jgi:hypothetical protein
MNLNHKIILLLSAGLALSPLSAQVSIGFEPSEGYRPGHVDFQPRSGTQWKLLRGMNNLLLVEAGKGIDGGHALVNLATGSGANFVYYGFDTDLRNLGGTFSPTSSKVAYSFAWRPMQHLDGDNGSILMEFSIGGSGLTTGDAAVSLRIHSSGRFQVYDGETLQTIDDEFSETGRWRTISGVIDFGSKTFTIHLDETQLFRHRNRGNLRFQNPESNNLNLRIGNLRGASDILAWREWALDAIELKLAPR